MNKQILHNQIMIRITIILIIFASIFAISIGIKNSRKFYITYYDIPENIQTVFTKNITAYLEKNNPKSIPIFNTIDDSISLVDALKKQKKYNLVFTYNGKNLNMLDENTEIKTYYSDRKILKGVTSSIKKTVTKNNNIIAIPLLSDYFELCCNNKLLKATNCSLPKTFDQLSVFADACKQYASNKNSKIPIQWEYFLAAADDNTLLEFIGAYIESLYGIQACKKLEKAIAGNSFEKIISTDLTGDGITLKNILTVFSKWKTENLVHPNLINLTQLDIRNFMKRNTAPAAFMLFSKYRSIKNDILVNHSMSFFPSGKIKRSRFFTAPVLCGINISKKQKKQIISEYILQYLISIKEQGNLCTATGLAPVQAQALTPDKEADDVRFWIAATEPPYPGLDRTAFSTSAERHTFAEQIRTLIR